MTTKTELKIDLPDHERGRSPEEIRRFDRLTAKLARKDLTPKQRQAAIDERQNLERAPDLAADREWLVAAARETIERAQARGEEVTQSKSGSVRVDSRDPLKALLKAGHLTAEQYDTGKDVRDWYEARLEDLGSQLGSMGAGAAHNNDAFVLARLNRSKAAQKIGTMERGILVGHFRFATGGFKVIDGWAERFTGPDRSEPHVALTILRAICRDEHSLRSQGAGRAFERNALALSRALDIAKELR